MMNKKFKIILLIIMCFILSGCSVNYDVEIYKGNVRVNGKAIESDSTHYDDKIYDITYRETVDLKTGGEKNFDPPAGIYKIDDERGLGIGLKNKYNLLEDYIYSPGIKTCYQYFDVIEEENKIILSTSLDNLCFDEYPILDDITVNLKTNHKVISSNADKVNGYHYTWNINRDNKNDAAIQITLEANKYIFNYENEILKKIVYIGLIVGIIVGVGGITYLHFKNKNNRLNEI